jgi:hypothetical protein
MIKSKRIGWIRHESHMVEKSLQIFVRNSEEKRSLGKSKHSWEDNVKMDLKEIGLECLD